MTDSPESEEVPNEPDIVVLAGNPDADDMAAATAVLSAVLEELAAESGRRESSGPSAWQRSQRILREPLHAENGAWRGFSA